jgi:hypothetical protein
MYGLRILASEFLMRRTAMSAEGVGCERRASGNLPIFPKAVIENVGFRAQGRRAVCGSAQTDTAFDV